VASRAFGYAGLTLYEALVPGLDDYRSLGGVLTDLGQLAWLMSAIRDNGFSVLAYDYRGYGASTGGPPSTRGAEEDLEAVYRYATTRLAIPPERIVLHGRSLGSGPAVALAAREPIGGLILESAFVSAYRVLTVIPILVGDRYPNLRLIRRVSAPVLVVHGRQDEVIPFWHGERLYAAAPEPRRRHWIEGGGHNDLLRVAPDEYFAALRDFRKMLETAAR
jgi:abhydrolase domain-containing protein 17